MATVAPTGNGDQAAVERRNGGTVLGGGNVAATSPMTKNLTLADVADDFGGSIGSKVIAQDGTGSQYTDRVGISGAVPGAIVDGTTILGYNADSTEWVMKGGRVTTTLGGVANTTLIGGQAGPDPTRDSTNQLEKTRTYGDMSINVLATPSSGLHPERTLTGGGTLKNFINPAVAGGATNSADSAANATRSVPGELVYMYGAKLPKQDNYKSKETYES